MAAAQVMKSSGPINQFRGPLPLSIHQNETAAPAGGAAAPFNSMMNARNFQATFPAGSGDGKRVRKTISRRTVDYNSCVVRHLEVGSNRHRQ